MENYIPQFGLYGEGRWIDNPEFVHIEDIEARSSDLGWRIKAHQHTQLFQILLLNSGSAHVRMDTENRYLEGKWAIIVPAGIVHGFRFSPETDGRVLSVSDVLIDQKTDSVSPHSRTLTQPGYINFNGLPEEFQHVWQLINLLEYEFHHVHDGKNALIEHLLKSILVLVVRHLSSLSHDVPTNSDETLIKRLKVLVNNQFKNHWKTTDYASQLNVSEKKLNRVTHQAFGKTVVQLVHERLILEAKRNLVYTQKSVEEIGYDLGFKDAGYFSRFFKRQEKLTPGKYRKLSEPNSL